MPFRKMPRDVATRWNSTYEMLRFAGQYKEAIRRLTANIDSKLIDFQLSADDWGYAAELERALSVSLFVPLNISKNITLTDISYVDLQ